MVKTLGYMVTWTTYGTWFEGDARGYVKKGKVLAGNANVLNRSKSHQEGRTVRLSKRQREIVREAIEKEGGTTGQKIHSVGVYSNHVHMVVGYDVREIEKAVSRYKNAAYRALRERGFEGRIWTRGYDKRYCFDEKSLGERIDYVRRHGS